MTVFQVLLTTNGDVRQLAAAADHCPCEVDARSGRYLVDARSIMGLFSLDLDHPVEVDVLGDDAQGEAFRREVAALVSPEP